jgi:hypothetical protein
MSAEKRIRDLYGFAFPDDFFRTHELLESLPEGLLASACEQRPAYPWAVAAGRPPREYPNRPIWEDRYYHDLPEFITLFYGGADGLHWGYFFDAPGELPPVVTYYWHTDTFDHVLAGDTVFEAIRWGLETSESDFREYQDEGEDDYTEELGHVEQVRKRLNDYWGEDRPETGADYLEAYGGSDWREPSADTWSRLGVVVPQGKYQPLKADLFSEGKGKRRTRRLIEGSISEARELLRGGYPGAALKLGHDLWAWGGADYPESYELLDAAYQALGREALRRLLGEARAFREHCDRERKGRG